MEEKLSDRLEQTGEEYAGLYSLFQEKGGRAVDVFHHADPENYHLPLPEEVYDQVDNQNLLPPFLHQGEFESIVNFLSRAEVLPTWNDSRPFRILIDEVDEDLLATAYEKVSGEQYNFPEDIETVEVEELPEYLRS